MSAIIKSADVTIGTIVRALPQQSVERSPPTAVDDRCERLERRILDLEARIATLTTQAADLRTEAEAALERGRTEGHKRGLQSAEDREEERVRTLANAILASRKDMAEALDATERLAALLAKACLDKLFSETDKNADHVCALLRAQMQEFEREQLVAVAVSAEDFSEEGLNRLRELVANDAVAIRRDPRLPSGSCKLQPRLGEMDIGLDTQWTAIGDLLLEIAGGRSPL